jgi:hypothetical protein
MMNALPDRTIWAIWTHAHAVVIADASAVLMCECAP